MLFSNTFNLLAIFAFTFLSYTASASPVERATGTNLTANACPGVITKAGCVDLTPVLPLTGGPTELPSPPSNLTLKHITLGRGIQNYTCASPSSTPLATGALAMLYDISPLAYTSTSSLLLAPPSAVLIPLQTLLLPASNPLSLPLAPSASARSYPILGAHYFGSDGTPTFDLSATKEILYGKKTSSVRAPVGAAPGPEGTGAVDWLALGDRGDAERRSVGLRAVYRVVTAGGNPPATCAGVGVNATVSVQYAALYWFYG